MKKFLTAFFVLVTLGLVSPTLAFQDPGHDRLPALDKRADQGKDQAARKKAAGLQHLKEQLPDAQVDFDSKVASPKWISRGTGLLSGPKGKGGGISEKVAKTFDPADPHKVTKAFLQEHRQLFGHGPEALDKAKVQREFVSPQNGMKTTVWQQELDGISVFEAVLISHVTKNEELVNIASQFIIDPAKAAGQKIANRVGLQDPPKITAEEAVVLAAGNVGEQFKKQDVTASGAPSIAADKRQPFHAPGLNGESDAHLVWLPLDENTLELCWEVILTSRAQGEMFRVLVDAQTGEIWLRHSLTAYLSNATYRVFTSDSPSPFSPGHATPLTSQPALINRTLVVTSALNTNASPNGWIDDAGNTTTGNNVDAHLDKNDDNIADPGSRPTGSPSRVFDFPMDLSQSSSTYTNASVVQLFYWCNWMHDKLYELGFTEAAGNFQINNFGRGGAGNDPVQADGQDGGGFNNANMSTLPDGSSPRMQMYIFSNPVPNRDGSFDAEVVLHEYTHGLSNRRVGGGVGLSALQSTGMGEGWSDFYGLTLLSESGDNVNGNYAAGGYASYLLSSGFTQNYYYGIRRYPYSTDMTKNPLTFKDIDAAQASAHTGVPLSPLGSSGASEVHSQGEVWCVTLWEARANLINKYGFAIGNQLILQLVTDGMNLSPPNPTFLQARDGIIQADLVNNGGANKNELWAAFAKRGMGATATSPSSSTTTGVHEAYDLPDNLQILPSNDYVISGPVGGPFTFTASLILTNTGGSALSWVATNTTNWLNVSQTSGVLASGMTTTVSVTLNANANSLPQGVYTNAVRFTNLNSGVVQTRQVSLRVGQPDNFTELFDAGDVDLSNSSITFTPNGSSDFYQACRQVISSFPTDPSTGTNLSLANHSALLLTLTGGAQVSIYGVSTNAFYLSSDGHLTFSTSDTSGGVSIVNHFFSRRVAGLFSHLHPGDGGSVKWQQLTNRAVITFQNIPEYTTSALNNFQMELFFDGRIRLSWLAVSTPLALTGLSAGQGQPANFLESDLSAYAVCAPPLKLTVPQQANENAGTLSGQGSFSIPTSVSTNLTATLLSSDTTELVVPATVTIPAGQTNATFDLTIVNDSQLDGTQNAWVTASIPGYQDATASIAVLDDESAVLKVTLPASTTEGSGTISGQLSINAVPTANISVSLSSSDTSEIQVPPSVTIPSGQTTAVFNVTVVDDSQIDGAQNATVTASVTNWTSGSATITVLDNELTNLIVTLPSQATEGDGILTNAGQVRISGTWPSNLTVALSSSDSTELTVPPSVTILAGQTSAVFNLTVVDDAQLDGQQTAMVTASASGFVTGATNIIIYDDESPLPPKSPSPANLANNVIVSADLAWLQGEATPKTNLYDVYFGTNSTPGAAEFQGTTTNTAWSLPTLAPATTYYWQIVARRVGQTAGPIWQFTTRGVDHFEWNPIASPQVVNSPFPVTIAAKDEFNATVTNFTGSVSLSSGGGVGPTNILLYEDVNKHYFRTALDELGLSYQAYSNATQAGFGTAVSAADPKTTLVIVDVGNNYITTYSPIISFVTNGGRSILEYWDLDTQPTLATAFSATTVGEINTPIPVYNWGGSQLFGGLPNPVSFVETTFDDDGDKLSPIAGAIAVGGYLNTPTNGQAAVIVGNSGRTILNGFLLDNAQIFSNGVQLAKNEIQALRGSSTSIVNLSPTNSGNFANGVWAGNITIFQTATNISLVATDGAGHSGTSNPFDTVPANDLMVTISDSPDPVGVGTNLTYTVTVANSGPSSATGVSLTNFLPSNVNLNLTDSSQGTYTFNGSNLLVFNLGTILGGSNATATIEVNPYLSGVITNRVAIGRAEADSYDPNNSATAVTVVGAPPVIISQPISQTVPLDGSVTFSANATGNTPLYYFWKRNGLIIPGATNSTYTTNTVQVADSGAQFSCLVSNTFGTALSSNAVLTVVGVPPSITSQSVSQTVALGGTVTFSVTASGSNPLSYQWRKGGTNLADGARVSGAVSNRLTIVNLQTNDGGTYIVVITNPYGSITSTNAVLTIDVPPPPAVPSNPNPTNFANNISVHRQLSWTGSGAIPTNIVVPNANVSAEADSNNGWPFNLAGSGGPTSQRYQQIYAANRFLGQGGTITQLRFRPDFSEGKAFGPTSMNVDIYLGYASTTVTNPSTTFAANIGAGRTLVYSGLLTLSSAASGGSPRNFDILIDVQDSFTYDPAVGSLLLDVFMYDHPATTQFDASTLGAMTRIYSTTDVSDPVGGMDAYGLVTMFSFNGATPVALNKTASNIAVVPPPDGEVLYINGESRRLKGQAPTTAASNEFTPSPSISTTSSALAIDSAFSQTTYNVYLGTNQSALSLIASNLTQTTCPAGTLGFNTTYYWQIVASNAVGTVAGPVWQFTTTLDEVHFASTNISVSEGGGAALITVVRENTAAGGIIVNYSTTNGTATAGSDYTTVSGTLTFPAGVVSNTFSVPILNDSVTETNETFLLRLSQPLTNVLLTAASNSVLTIIDDDVPDYFTELFDGTTRTNDLAYRTITFTPNGSISFYAACEDTALFFPTDPTGGTNLALGSHTYLQLTLSTNISIYGQSANVIFLASEGHLTLGSGDSSGSATLANHFSKPRVSASFAHIHPTESGGTVSLLQLANRVAITFNNVVEYGTTRTNSFQMELFYDGRIRLTFLGLGTPTGLIGLSAGQGIPPLFASSDLSTYGSCGPQPPFIVSQPVKQAVRPGTNVTFCVTAVGTSPIRYQWRKDGTNLVDGGRIIGATNGCLTIASAMEGDSGDYSVTLTNDFGATSSSNATLLVSALDHFTWSNIPSPQSMGTPFPVTITAQDQFGSVVSNFTGSVALNGSAGGGQATNVILGSAIHNNSGSVTPYTLGYSFTPNTNLSVTHVRHYFGSKVSIWTESGTLLAAQNVTSVPGTWVETPLASPLQLTNGVRYRVGIYFANTNYYWRNDMTGVFPNGSIDQSYEGSGDAFPTTSDSARWWFVDLRYTVGASVPVAFTPTNSGNFVNGVWTGSITVLQTATNISLVATEATGHRGTSTNFDVGLANDISVVIVDRPDPITVGGYLTNTITVANSGPAAATGATATNFLPPSVNLVSAIASQGSCALVGNRVECTLGTIAGGTNATITIVTIPRAGGSMTNRVVIGRAEADVYTGNNSAESATTVIMPTLSIADLSITEGTNGVTTNALVSVSLSPASSTTVSINFATTDGTALSSFDYIATNGTLFFYPGETNKKITVVIKGDALNESNEIFYVNLTGATNASLGYSQAAVTIVDDDPLPLVYIDDLSAIEANAGTNNLMPFTIHLSAPSGRTSSVAYATTNGTAISGSDFVSTNGTVTFNPGETNKTVYVRFFGDNLAETNEYFYINLSAAVNLGIGDSQAIGTILDDDSILAPGDRLVWSQILSPQQTNGLFPVTLSAKDGFNNQKTSFTGNVNLSAFDFSATGTNNILGNISPSASDNSGGLSLGYSFTPTNDLLVTHVRHYAGSKVSIWTDTGSLLTSQNVNGPEAAWTETALSSPLWLSAGARYRIAVFTGGATYYWQTNGALFFADGAINESFDILGDAFPTNTNSLHWYLVDLRYTTGTSTPMTISPTVSGSFTNGAWGGTVSIAFLSSNVILQAQSGLVLGYSNPFRMTNTCAAPSAAVSLIPATGSTNVSLTPVLIWKDGGLSSGSCPVSYDVYLGTNAASLDLFANGVSSTNFTLGSLAFGTTYYWQIVANRAEVQVPGPVWNFRTVPPPTPPSILTQPASVAAYLKSNAFFNVVATGSAPLSYQWRFNGTALNGSTNFSLGLTNVNVNHAGLYSVIVSNSAGWIVSSNALLTVMPITNLTLNVFDLGWYDSTGFHDPANRNYFVGDGSKLTRNWFVFNIPAFTGTVSFAELRVNSYNVSSPTGSETYQLRNVITPPATVIAGGSGKTSVYADLGDGAIYGSRDFAITDGNQFISMTLNSNLIANVTAARGGMFAIGGEIATLDGQANNNESCFAFSTGASNDVQLILRFPVPGLLDHFAWAPIPSLEEINQPFPVAIMARDGLDNPVTNFSGTLNLSVMTSGTVSPAISENFTNGLWTGFITAQTLSSNMVLRADDGLGHAGLANSFSVVAPFARTLACSLSGPDLVISWPAPSANYLLEMTETLSPPSWTPVTNIVVLTNNTVVLTNAMSATNKFYRLRRN